MKKLVLILSLVFGRVLFAQVPTAGLVSQWPFSGNANDIVGSNNGTVNNATLTADRFGNPNCAYNFNGSNSYIVMANAGVTGTVSRSISFWGRTSNTNLTAAFGCGDAGAFAIEFNYGCSGVGYDDGTGAFIMSNSNVSDGNWHHYTAVYDATLSALSSGIKFYMDGTLLSSLACTIGSTVSTVNTSTTYPINIGKVSDNFIRFFDGNLDDFFLYNRALSPSEVLALYNDMSCAGTPSAPAAIMGNITVCAGSAITYSVAPVAGATSYTWTLPGGWTGTSTTNTILINVGSSSGQIAVAAKNCCSSSQPVTLDIMVSTCTGIKEELKNAGQFIISPNPNKGIFTIKSVVGENSKLEIYNNLGQLVYTKRLEKAEEKIDIKLPNGVYFATVRSENGSSGSQHLVITD